MTDINHHRKNKKPVNQRYEYNIYNNGYAAFDGVRGNNQRVGKTDFLDKSMHSWGRKSLLADKSIGAHIGNDYTNGHRGMAKAVKGAKKYVRTRIRFNENAMTRKIANEMNDSSNIEQE